MKIFKEDAAEGVFFNRQLEYIMPASFDVKYPNLVATELVPVDTSAGPGAEKITWRQYDRRGMAKIVANYATDFPRADVTGMEFFSPVKAIGAAFGYNIQEMRAAMLAAQNLGGTGGRTLDQRRADAAMRAMLEKQDVIITSGDVASGLPGFLTNSNVTAATAANVIGAASTTDQILAVLNAAVNNVVTLTNGVELPTDMLLTYKAYNYIAATARSATSDTTILNFFKANNPYIKNIRPWTRLTGAGTGATDLMVVYVKDSQHLAAQVPQPVELFPAQQTGLEWEVKLHSRQGGTLIFYPLSMSYTSGT